MSHSDLGSADQNPPDHETVLVVEDDVLVQRALLRLFRTQGYRVQGFGTVDEFFEHPSLPSPACLVLDLHLPGGHGIDILDRLSAAGERVPAVVLTAHGDVSSAVRAMKRGAIEFLEKPFDQETLLASVAAGMNQARVWAETGRRKLWAVERLARLTPREREVFELVVAGRLNKQIAARLGVAEQTVKVHRGRVMEKMEADSLAELVRLSTVLASPGAELS